MEKDRGNTGAGNADKSWQSEPGGASVTEEQRSKGRGM
jgi:hypothetical protein